MMDRDYVEEEANYRVSKNVITQYPKVAENLKQQLTLLHNQDSFKQKNPVNITEFDPEVKKRLSDLGYI